MEQHQATEENKDILHVLAQKISMTYYKMKYTQSGEPHIQYAFFLTYWF